MWVAHTLLLSPTKMGSVSDVWKFVLFSADVHTMVEVSMSSFIHSLYMHTYITLSSLHAPVHAYAYVYVCVYSSPFPAIGSYVCT